MKYFLLLLSLFALSASNFRAQNSVDSISVVKSFGGSQYYSGDRLLKVNELVYIMEDDKLAVAEMNKAKSTYITATTISVLGGFMVGYPIGSALSGAEPNWGLVGIGVGLIVISIPITKKFNTTTQKAISIYNMNLRKTSFWDKRELRLSTVGNSVGICFKF